nr:MAG TPA: hypothetical protein [Caudoviricetes sp.]
MRFYFQNIFFRFIFQNCFNINFPYIIFQYLFVVCRINTIFNCG